MSGLVIGGALCLATVMPASAASMLLDYTVSTSNVVNGGSVMVTGTTNGYGAGGVFSSPWTALIFVGVGECLRLDVTFEGGNLELIAVSPRGHVYRNDDRNGAADRRPLVKIDNAPLSGWYTVTINNTTNQGGEIEFDFRYGRYNGGNANCAGATPPLSSEAASGKPTNR